MRFCPSCLWIDLIVWWNRLFPLRSEVRRLGIKVDLVLQAEVHIHNRINKLARHSMDNASEIISLGLVVDQLYDKVNESNDTLKGLASEVLKLRGDLAGTDVEAQIAAIRVKAQAALDALAKAEDDADDALPVAPPPAPVDEPPPAPVEPA